MRPQASLLTACSLMVALSTLIFLNIALRDRGFYGWPLFVFSNEFTYFDALRGYHTAPTQDNFPRTLIDLAACLAVLSCVFVAAEDRSRANAPPLNTAPYISALATMALFGIWNGLDPLRYYFMGDLTAPFLVRVLTWLILAFIAGFLAEAAARTSRK